MTRRRMLRTVLPAVALATGGVVTFGTLALRAQSLSQDPIPRKPQELVLQAPPATSVNSVAVSPQGSLVATAGGEGGVRLYDARTGALQRVLGDVGDRSVVFSPDGRTLAAAGFHMDLTVGLYDVTSGKRVRALAGHKAWEADATAISPDGKLLASTGTDHQLLVWDLATGEPRHRLAGQPSRLPALAFSRDSSLLAAAGDREIRLWEMSTGHVRRVLTGHRDWVTAVAFSPDGKTLASGSCDWSRHRGRNTAEFDWQDPGCVSEWKLWDAATGAVKRTVSEPGRLLSLAFSPDGSSIACAVGKEARLYDLRGETPARVIARYGFDATSVAFTPDGKSLVSGSHDQTARRVDLASGKLEWEAGGSWEQVNSVALSPDGSLLVTGSSDRRFAVRTLKVGAAGLRPGAARLWDARKGRLLRRLGGDGDPAEQVMAVAFSPDGARVAIGGADLRGAGTLRVSSASDGTLAWSTADHTAEVLAVAFAPDGSSLASAGADGVIQLRDPRTGAVRQTLSGHEGGATSLVYSPDGATLVCGEGRGGTRVWDVRTGRLLRTCRDPQSRAGAVTTDRMFTTVGMSPDGATFVASAATVGNTYGEPVRLWDARTGELKRVLPATNGRPIALSPDGTLLATGGKTIRLWDVRSGKRLREFSGILKKTQSLAFSADGRLLFAGGSWATTNAWEVATGRHLVTLFTFPKSVEGKPADDWLAYHPDGYYHGSPGAENYLAWRVGDELKTPATLGKDVHRPDRVEARLTLRTESP